MRWLAFVALVVGMASTALAQNPDLVFQIDGRMQFLGQREGPTFVRFYDNLGRHSVASIRAFLEIGFQAFVSQKFARIPKDADSDQLDEYYVEDEGLWRLGKQYLPFGGGNFLRESVLAARGETTLLFENFPIVVAACDAGEGKQRGFVGRLGSNYALSFAVGRHFGINGTSFDLVRRPEESPGAGRGYREIYGFDLKNRVLPGIQLAGEAVLLRSGETSLDRDNFMFDLSAHFDSDPDSQLTFGWTRDIAAHHDFYRAGASIFFSRYLTMEPMIRYRNSELYDLSLTAHFRF